MPAPSPPAARPQQGCACSSAKPGAAHERPVSYRPYRLGALAPGRLRGTDRSAGMVAPFESTAEARVSPIDISRIRIDGGTQSRANLNESVVAEYAEAMTEGAKLPAVTVFFDGSEYWLADGFHRYHGHKRIGALKIDAEVLNGTRRDAVLHSVGANAAHGLRRIVLTLLVDDRVDRHRGLAGLAVADDQLALAAADRHHRVDGLQAGLHRLRHRLPCDHARRHLLDHVAHLG